MSSFFIFPLAQIKRLSIFSKDADAIVLDFGLRIESIVADVNADVDIIASADIRMGLINTGFFIVKNTKWAR